MKIFLALTLIFFKSYAQKTGNYIRYYDLCNSADKLENNKNYSQALNKFDSAFKLVHYQSVSNLVNAALTAINLKNKEKAIVYLKRAVLNGFKPSSLSNKEFGTLNDHKKFKQLKDSSFILNGYFRKRIDSKYAKEADSLFYVDQVIIRNVKVSEPLYKVNFYVYASERTKYDSISFQYVLKLIKEKGFPSEEKIGSVGYENIKLVIHHSIRMPYFKEQMELFKQYVLSGEYFPEDFAWAYDQSRLNLNEKPYFYFRVGDPTKLSEKEKEDVNARRKQYGLRPLEDDKIVKEQ